MPRNLAAAATLVLIVAACGTNEDVSTPAEGSATPASTSTAATTGTTTPSVNPPTSVANADCANVVAVDISGEGELFSFATTVLSGDTGWDKYADWWEVRGGEGEVLGVRQLAHPHETEQPFTRSLDGVMIPRGMAAVEVVAHDSVLGFCGASMVVRLPGR